MPTPDKPLASPIPVVITNWQGILPTDVNSIPLTDSQLRAAAVPISFPGGVSVSNFPATQPVSGPATDAQIRATPVPISGTVIANVGSGTQPVSGSVSVSNLPATQPVSGTVAVSNFPATQPVSGPATDAQMRAAPIPISGTITANVGTGTQPVSGSVSVSNFPATQPVSLAVGVDVTDRAARLVGHVTLDNASLPVTGTFFQATQPVSLATAVDITDRAARLAGHVTIDNASLAVTGTFFQATQPVSAAALPLPSGASTEATLSGLNGKVTACNTGAVTVSAALPTGANIIGSVSLGNATGKANIGQTGSLASTAVTADQVIKSYQVTAGKTLYITAISINARLTTFAVTATLFGTASLETPAGTKLYTETLAGPGVLNEPIIIPFSEPIPIAAGVVVRLVCTPAAVTAMTWQGTILGYEK